MARDADDIADFLLEDEAQVLARQQFGRAQMGEQDRAFRPSDGRRTAIRAPGVKMRRRAVLTGLRGSMTKTVSARLNSRAIACMRAGSSPSLSSTTASGLPASAVSVKTSSV